MVGSQDSGGVPGQVGQYFVKEVVGIPLLLVEPLFQGNIVLGKDV